MYNILLRFIYLFSHIPFIYSKKYENWFLAQKQIFKKLDANKEKSIWIHCSSLGEYEQIKPLIPKLKKINPLIIITFFSSSGYLNFNDFDLITKISYLPLDIKYNMHRFMQLINPDMVLISKNDIWPNMVTCLHDNKIPVYLIGCKLHKVKINNWLIRWYYKKYLPKFSHIFCQDKITYEFLKSNNIHTCSLIGDTRINQVLIDAKKEFKNSKISNFINKRKTIIYGSVEKSDYNIILNTINSKKDVCHIIVPHDINKEIIDNLKNQIKSNYLIYSEIDTSPKINENILIIDIFGILKKLYQYSDIAYIGGGFHNGVHNTLEPAIHNNLLLFGPKYMNFSETVFFIDKKIATSITNRSNFENQLNLFLGYQSKEKTHNITSSFFNQKKQNVDYIINKFHSPQRMKKSL